MELNFATLQNPLSKFDAFGIRLCLGFFATFRLCGGNIGGYQNFLPVHFATLRTPLSKLEPVLIWLCSNFATFQPEHRAHSKNIRRFSFRRDL